MPRKLLRKYLPSRESIRGHRHIARFDRWLHHPNLWHLNRDSVAGGVAAGLFAGLVPGTHLVKFPVAALSAIAFRVNLPVATIVTLYNNPLTGVPLYILAYNIGRLIVPDDAAPLSPAPEFDWPHIGAWLGTSFHWILSLGKPLAIGLPVLAVGLGIAGYAFVQIGWRAYVTLAWRRRKARRRA